MAKQQSKRNKKSKQPQHQKQPKPKNTGDAVAGEQSAFVVGCLGVLVLASFVLPWYASSGHMMRGYELVFGYGDAPQALRNALGHAGGNVFLALIVLQGLLTVGIGFGWPTVARKLGNASTEVCQVLGVGALLLGLLLMLCTLEMDVRGNVDIGTQGAYLFLLLAGGGYLAMLMALDRAAGRVAHLLEWSDWGIWLGAVAATVLVHYLAVCYKLIKPAPEALRAQLGRFR